MTVQSAPMKTVKIHPDYARAKRFLDITFTLLILPLILLAGAVVAVLIWLDSPGPTFYRQKRVGQNGVEFEMLKFRSMYVDNDDSTHRETIKQYINGEALNGDGEMPYKMGDDLRVTRVGRIIRKISFDELPQFWNVLWSQMSLVGPRPPVPYEVELYTQHDWLRLAGKSGLTGVWQVYGRSKASFQEMIEMDITYLQRQSLWLDIKLIVLTVPVMLLGRGGA